MERQISDVVWIEVDEGFLPQSLVIEDALEAPEVAVSLTVCSDAPHPVFLERVCVAVVGNSAYVGQVELTGGAGLPARETLAACAILPVGEVTVRSAVRHRSAAEGVESTMPFSLSAWAEWRSQGELFVSRPVTLQAFEPAAFTQADDAFSLTPVE